MVIASRCRLERSESATGSEQVGRCLPLEKKLIYAALSGTTKITRDLSSEEQIETLQQGTVRQEIFALENQLLDISAMMQHR